MSWACEACTLRNEPWATECAACEAPRPTPTPSAPPEPLLAQSFFDPGDDEVHAEVVPLATPVPTSTSSSSSSPTAASGVEPAWPMEDGPAGNTGASASRGDANKDRATRDILTKVQQFAKEVSTRSQKRVPAAFTGKAFAQEFVRRGWAADEAGALRILQNDLLDKDIANAVPYVRHPEAKADETVYRLGRRYGCERAKLPAARLSFVCAACDLQTLVPLPRKLPKDSSANLDEEEATWICKDCTYRNSYNLGPALRAAGIAPDGADQSYVSSLWEAGKSGLSQLSGLVWSEKVDNASSEQRVRAALQRAVLLHADAEDPGSWTDPPPLHELLAVDRSSKVRGSGPQGGSRPGTADADEPLQSVYAPVAMRRLRAHFGIAEDFFCESLFEHELKMRSDTGGRSDSLFFFSADRHFVVKTVPKAEMILLRRMLPDYFAHMLEDLDSFLPRFLALFKVRPWPDKDPVHCVVMTNVLDSSLEVNKVFDLKGSTANRFVSMERQRDEMEKHGKLPTLKDLNWKDPMRMPSAATRAALLAQIMADTQLLVRYGVMDYSLLIGVHTQAAGKDDEGHFPLRRTRWQTYHGGLPTESAVYFIGIIDVLQEYDVYKQAERFVKTSILSPISGYLQKSRANGDEVQIACPYCKFQHNKLPAPKADSKDPPARVVQVSCAACGASFDHAEEGIATSDTNISSIEPAGYRRRLLEFAETKVFV